MPDQRVTFFLYKGGACCGLVIDPKIPYSILLEGQIGLSANFQMEDLVCVSNSNLHERNNMELFRVSAANRDYQLPGLLARDYEWADHTG